MLQPATITHCSSYWPPWMWTRTAKWDVAPPAFPKQIEQGRVLVIFCPPYLIDIPLEPARCRCARAMIRALLGCWSICSTSSTEKLAAFCLGRSGPVLHLQVQAFDAADGLANIEAGRWLEAL